MKRPILSASIATVVAVCILIGLGVWQIRRLHWKEGLLAQIDAAERAPPAVLPDGTPPQFARVIAHGVLRGGHVALFGAEVRGMHMGAQAIEVLDRPGQRPILVDLGWVATDEGRPAALAGPIDVTGYVRRPETPNALSAADDPEDLRFYTLTPATIGAALGAPDVVPFTLVALKTKPQGAPAPAEALPRPPNNHLQYALTWFGLAAALLGVFGAWVFSGRRDAPAP